MAKFISAGVKDHTKLSNIGTNTHAQIDTHISGAGLSPWTRTVIVDIGGKGDYTSVKTACDYVATQSLTSSTPWQIIVMPGIYAENNFTVPAYTRLVSWNHANGIDTTSTGAQVTNSGKDTTGTFVTLADRGAIEGILIRATGTPTGNVTALATTSNRAWINGVVIYHGMTAATYTMKGIDVGTSYVTWITNTAVNMQGASMTNAIGVHATAGLCEFLFGWIRGQIAGGTGIQYSAAGSGNNTLAFVRFGPSAGSLFTNDIVVDAGASTPVINNTPYKNSSGTLSHFDRWFPSEAAIREAPASTDTPLIVKGAPSQAVDLTQWQDSSGNVLTVVDENGNVGIGTTSPGAKLEIASGGILLSNNQALQIKDTGGAVRNVIKVTNADLLQISGTKSGGSTVGQIAFYTGDTNEKMRIDQNGNVGIGVTEPAFKLDVAGSIGVSTSGNIGIALDSTDSSNMSVEFNRGATSRALFGVAGSAGAIITGSAQYDFAIRANNKAILFSTDNGTTAHMAIKSGSVGIGTASPGALLEVEGATRPRIMLDDGSTQKGRWGANDDGVFFLSNNINYDGTNWNLDSTSDEGIIAVLRNDGATNGRFEIVTAPAAANPATLSTRFSVWENGDVALGGSITAGALTGATIVAKNDGNVGFGTTSPATKIHTSSNTDNYAITMDYATAGIGAIHLQGRRSRGTIASPGDLLDGDYIWGLGGKGYKNGGWRDAAFLYTMVDGTPGASYLPGAFLIATTNTSGVWGERFRVSSDGNVGINETVPDYKLDVNGSLGFTPGSSVTPVDNGDVVIEATNNTTLTFKLKGSDGTVRSGTLTLA